MSCKVISPAQLKAYLCSLKERYLDHSSPETNPLTASEAFLGVLKMELLLRGVIVEDDKKIYKQIQSSAGKTLLVDDSSLKISKPLLAGVNVMAGRITEALYNQLTTLLPLDGNNNIEKNSNFSFPKHLISYEETLGAIQRAKEVEDERWPVILQIISSPPSLLDNNKTEGDGVNINNYFNSVLQIALGYYTTAALIQSDTPPMWKKIWDVWNILAEKKTSAFYSDHSSPYEAQIAIKNLIRIALSKNNTKRASELQLCLIQSYLNQNRIELAASGNNSKTSIAQSFGDSITQDQLQDKKNDTKYRNAEKARSTLIVHQSYFEEEIIKQKNEESSTTTIDCGIMLYQILQVETLMAQEDADDIQQDAQERIEISNELVERASILRDTLIAIWSSTFNICLNSKKDEKEIKSTGSTGGEIKNLQLCFYWVYQSILRLKYKAEIISQNTRLYYKSWDILLQYILPILKEMEKQIAETEKISFIVEDNNRVQTSIEWLNKTLEKDGSRNAKMKLIETVVSLLPNVFWMLIGDGDGNIIIDPLHDEFKLVADILSGLIQWQDKIESERLLKEKITLAVGSKESPVKISTIQWQNAKESALCFVCQDNNASIYEITSNAISSSKKKMERGFLAFLQCLVSWSGLYQHPWPYCTNHSDARRLLNGAKSDLGRPLTVLEETLLTLANADAELLNGGFIQNASEQYSGVLGKLQKDGEPSIDTYYISLLQTHCYNGIARIQKGEQYTNDDSVNGLQTKKSIEILEDVDIPLAVRPLSIWNSRSICVASKAHQLSVARQLIADSLIRFGRFEEALSFLKAAVADSPLDADAAMAFGAFLLRVAFYVHKERNKERDKEARINLLKAAKLDPSKSNPFALLGIFYEDMGDSKRARGCFMKSLKLDPCNPIAGRGLLRLATNKADHLDVLEFAIDNNSPLNGWAWHAVGLNKSYNDGDDDLAVVAILKALRCRDVAIPDKEIFGVFYEPPSLSYTMNERSAALAHVGMCYRRLGRFTASIRAFYASIDAAGVDSVQSAILISCAQVEQELGCFEEAAEKFASVIQRKDINLSVALYGQAVALFSNAKRDLVDGKAGAAFGSIEQAIQNCMNSSIKSGCESKLLGDLYSFGASFPIRLFCDEDNLSQDINCCFQKQLEFISRGEDAFRSSLKTQNAGDEEDRLDNNSSILCDIALNILLQAQLLSSIQIDGNSIEVIDKYDRAAEAFRLAIEYDPIHAASWCGLGCSVLKIDPLLAQHAFSRCVQIEAMSPDAYANVGFLYTSKLAINASRSTMEALTQVADTPMMWMNCAFILEREAERSLVKDNRGKPEDNISQAADAYRASLQVMRHPEAQLGLSLTGRMMHSKEEKKQDVPFLNLCTLKRKDCFSFMNEYMDFNGKGVASIIQGVMSIEKGSSIPPYAIWQKEIFMEGKETAGLIQAQEGENISCKSFNTDSIGKLAVAVETPIERKKKNKCSSSVSMEETNLQRLIWNQPDRADLWLLLAKEFIENDAIESACTAASRASFMLSQELILSHRINDQTPSFVDAKIISGAISLEFWLKEILMKKPSVDATYRLQRALMMDPGNDVARKGLLLAHVRAK